MVCMFMRDVHRSLVGDESMYSGAACHLRKWHNYKEDHETRVRGKYSNFFYPITVPIGSENQLFSNRTTLVFAPSCVIGLFGREA